MEKSEASIKTSPLRNYVMLTKPGIIIGNAITAIGGFAFASKGYFDFWLFLAMLEGLCLIIGSACVFNNYIDQKADRQMLRTKNRPLARGDIASKRALIYGSILLICGSGILLTFTNFLTLFVSITGFIIYVGLYSFLKYQTVYATLIGSFAGAVPPVIGYVAVTGTYDLTALLLFATVAFWQMPHFFAIAIRRLDDYRAASIPVLPLVKGIKATKIQTLLYLFFFLLIAPALFWLRVVGPVYVSLMTCVGIVWLFLGIRGFWIQDDHKWASQMFIFSLLVIMTFSATVAFTWVG
jgi:protoheme IX farnesyltransferase